MQSPLHPIFVHFTIALTVASFGFDLGGALAGRQDLAVVGWWTLAAAAGVTPITIATGISSRIRLPIAEGPARSLLRVHMALGVVFFGLVLMACGWRAAFWERAAPVPPAYLVSMGGLLLVMAVQGYLGGELIYRYGAEVRAHYRPLATDDSAARRFRPAESERR